MDNVKRIRTLAELEARLWAQEKSDVAEGLRLALGSDTDIECIEVSHFNSNVYGLGPDSIAFLRKKFPDFADFFKPIMPFLGQFRVYTDTYVYYDRDIGDDTVVFFVRRNPQLDTPIFIGRVEDL